MISAAASLELFALAWALLCIVAGVLVMDRLLRDAHRAAVPRAVDVDTAPTGVPISAP